MQAHYSVKPIYTPNQQAAKETEPPIIYLTTRIKLRSTPCLRPLVTDYLSSINETMPYPYYYLQNYNFLSSLSWPPSIAHIPSY